MGKIIPIGFEDIKTIIDKDYYYVDKSLMIKELIDSLASVTLFTRPRRFGKTLNLSMLRRFFEKELDSGGKQIDNGYIFDALAISSCGEKYTEHKQKYPVINLSLKSAKQPDFSMAYESLIDEISNEYRRHAYLLDDNAMSSSDQERFEAVLNRRAGKIEYAKSLDFLSGCLYRYHHKKVIILIDEYDVPLENAYFRGFYQEMTDFIRSLFESALKTNSALEFAVITGCLRISRESIFTGLNNLEIHSILSPSYGDCFGFTEKEIKDLLRYYGLQERFDCLRAWYDGYFFGDAEVYNPWSVLNYVKGLNQNRNVQPLPYWSNTSSNSIIRELVEEADLQTRSELEFLMGGGILEKPVQEDITYEDIHKSRDNLWNFLYFTGYLKSCGSRREGRTTYLKLAIPNEEIAGIYENTIKEWVDCRSEKVNRSVLIKALEEGDCKAAESFISNQLLETISFYDYGENYYHGFLVGLLKGVGKYEVLSNRESGTGRADIILQSPSVRGGAMVLELKRAFRFDEMEECCKNALQQIKTKDYSADLRKRGYSDIRCYGICFYRKECKIIEG